MAGRVVRSVAGVGGWGVGVRRVPIRVKLLAALASPVVGLLVVVLVEVADTSRDARRQLDQTDLATAAVGPSGLMSALQDERNWASIELIGEEGTIVPEVSGYANTRRRTDRAIARFRAEVQRKGGAVAEAYRPALDGLVELGALRDDIDVNHGPKTLVDNGIFTNDIFQRYASLIMPFLEGNTRVALGLDDPDLREGAQLIDAISRQSETTV